MDNTPHHKTKKEVRFSGNVYYTRTHDSLKISNGKWCWHSRGIGGRSALDYLIKVRGMKFTEAVEQIYVRHIFLLSINNPVLEKNTNAEINFIK